MQRASVMLPTESKLWPLTATGKTNATERGLA